MELKNILIRFSIIFLACIYQINATYINFIIHVPSVLTISILSKNGGFSFPRFIELLMDAVFIFIQKISFLQL